MFKFGFEIEFAGPFGIDRDALCRGHNFCLDFDGSASFTGGPNGFYEGYELRSGILTQFPDSLKELLDRIKRSSCFVHQNCGFHIHFSGIPIDFVQLRDKIASEKLNWKRRDQWCTQIGGPTYKNQPVRQVEGDHYEVRAFNSTLSFRGLKKMFELAVRRIEDARLMS